MSGKADEFLKLKKEKNVVAANMFRKLHSLGYDDDFLDRYQEIEQIILDLHPSNIRSITTICSIMGSYAKFINNDNAYQAIRSIDRKLLWNKAKSSAAKRFITHEQYLNVLRKIEMHEETNVLYYKTLFRVIYEGIYCDDMSVIANLRASDIKGNIIELHKDSGYTYKMSFPEELIKDLQSLSATHEWERKNRFGVYQINVTGKYPDSCFKKKKRKEHSDSTFKCGYYNRLRKIIKEYMDYYISPLQLFVSGIMYRIGLELDKNNISIEDAFSNENRNRTVYNIISKELSRCEYDITVNSFREQVVGHLEVFSL